VSLPAAVTVEQSLLAQDVSRVYWILTVLVGLFVPITHIRNIRRLIDGSENRFSFSRHRGVDGD
jgi:hypothetical protein